MILWAEKSKKRGGGGSQLERGHNLRQYGNFFFFFDFQIEMQEMFSK